MYGAWVALINLNIFFYYFGKFPTFVIDSSVKLCRNYTIFLPRQWNLKKSIVKKYLENIIIRVRILLHIRSLCSYSQSSRENTVILCWRTKKLCCLKYFEIPKQTHISLVYAELGYHQFRMCVLNFWDVFMCETFTFLWKPINNICSYKGKYRIGEILVCSTTWFSNINECKTSNRRQINSHNNTLIYLFKLKNQQFRKWIQ